MRVPTTSYDRGGPVEELPTVGHVEQPWGRHLSAVSDGATGRSGILKGVNRG